MFVHTTLCLKLPTREFWKTTAQDCQTNPDHRMGQCLPASVSVCLCGTLLKMTSCGEKLLSHVRSGEQLNRYHMFCTVLHMHTILFHQRQSLGMKMKLSHVQLEIYCQLTKCQLAKILLFT